MTAAEIYSARRRAAPLLDRVAFRTRRPSEFCGVKELTKQVGRPPDRWPEIILKELTDNALDAAEDAGLAPEIDIAVSTETGEIVIADNGPGLPPETIGGVTDYGVRVSSREAYISPSRGQQGSALKCIIAMAFALDGERGETVIESRGQAHLLVFEMDRVRREPRIPLPWQVASSDVQIGTRITVRWASNASHLLSNARGRFVQMAAAFTAFNPHLRLRCRWNYEDLIVAPASDRDWRKWRTCDFTSAHWYTLESFERYIAAHIARDLDYGLTGRKVRDFIRELRGLRRADAQKLVLAETASARTPLDEFFGRGSAAIAQLLASCKRHSEPVKPKLLGLIGADHLMVDCISRRGGEESFQYRKHLGTTNGGLPYVLEAAFAFCPDGDDGVGRQIVSGINFSVAFNNPFAQLGHFEDLSSALERQYIERDAPVVLILHYTSPRVDFSDHGKTMLTLPPEVGKEAAAMIKTVTKTWAEQRRAEQRRESAMANRTQKLMKAIRRQEKEPPSPPTGVLADKITAAGAQFGVPVDTLLVLSPQCDPYAAWRYRRNAEWFARLSDRFVPACGKKHLRGLFYRCVMTKDEIRWPNGKVLVNNYNHWSAFLRAASAARWLGLVPFNRISDERNAEAVIYVPSATPVLTRVIAGADCTFPDTVAAAVPSFALDGFHGRQSHRIIFYGEKTSLAEVLDPIARQIGAELVLVTGESSHTRLEESIERANKDPRPAVLFYFADFDPSGHQMAISVARKAQAMRDLQCPDLKIRIYRVALRIDQVRDWELPSKPLSEKEKRASNWLAKFGHAQTEIDAAVELAPEKLRQAVFDAIRPFYDDTLDRRVHEAERKWSKAAEETLQSHPDHKGATERITAAYEKVQATVEELRHEQELAAQALQGSIPQPPPLPEAKPRGVAKAALFDSETDFVTATRHLIADKKLLGSEDESDDEATVEGDAS
jgi:hypothetical protein